MLVILGMRFRCTRILPLFAGLIGGCADSVPDEWGRFCGTEAEDTASAECEAPFECVIRDDITWATEPHERHICSMPCETDADCAASWGDDRVPECNKSIGFCKDYVVSG